MTNIVYMYEFLNVGVKSKYIGSKFNCIIENDLITKDGFVYKGSSTDPDYFKLWENNKPILHILYEEENLTEYLHLILKEKEFIILYDAHNSNEFFNKSIPQSCNFTLPNFATYYDNKNDCYQRVNRNDLRIQDGQFVGVTKNKPILEETKQKISKSVKNSYMDGNLSKKISESVKIALSTEEAKEKMSKAQKKSWASDQNRRNVVMEKVWKKPASEKQKAAASKNFKNKVTLKNKDTGQVIQINKYTEEYKQLDREIWKTPFVLSGKAYEEFLCPHCNRLIKSKVCFNRWHNDNCKHKKDDINENSQ